MVTMRKGIEFTCVEFFFFKHLLRIKYTVLCIYKSMLARRLYDLSYGIKGYIDYISYWTVMT